MSPYPFPLDPLFGTTQSGNPRIYVCFAVMGEVERGELMVKVQESRTAWESPAWTVQDFLCLEGGCRQYSLSRITEKSQEGTDRHWVSRHHIALEKPQGVEHGLQNQTWVWLSAHLLGFELLLGHYKLFVVLSFYL